MTTEKRRLPVKSTRVNLDGDYEGFYAVARLNMPCSFFMALAESASMAERHALWAPYILEWNILDDDGADLPVSAESLAALPLDMFRMLIDKINEAMEAPKSA